MTKDTPILNVEAIYRLEIGDLIRFIAENKALSYKEAESLVPDRFFSNDECWLCVTDHSNDEMWCVEVIEYMKNNSLESILVYQD
jgi:hypothetical protein